jgi:hypothetical protein
MKLILKHLEDCSALPRLVNKSICRVALTCSLAMALTVAWTAAAAENEQTNSGNPSNSKPGSATTTSRAPFSAFKIVTTTNIFNTKRQPGYKPSPNPGYVRPKSIEAFGLVGVMTYEKGPFAFFEGSASEFQKVLKPDETIAGFKLGDVQAGSVKLISPTNELELKVGMQLTRADGGPWQLGQRPENLDSRVTWNAQPAARREERPQQDTPFPFPPPDALQGLPDAIQQAIASGLQNAGQGGGPQPVIIQTPNGQNGNAVILQSGAAESGDVLQRLIRRRQQQEQGGGQGNP